jgi:SNF2 family DNA or RNA helicase
MEITEGNIREAHCAVASHVYLIEPQWNPPVEKQAIGRVLRMGQGSEVVITPYIM